MKKLLVLLCMLAFAAPTFAAGQAKKPTARYSGIVEKYDASTHTLTVKKKDKQGEFVIADTSEVQQDGKKADAAALTAGAKVDVTFVMDGAKKVAQKINVEKK